MDNQTGQPSSQKSWLERHPRQRLFFRAGLFLPPVLAALIQFNRKYDNPWLDALLISYNLAATLLIFATAKKIKMCDPRVYRAWLIIGFAMVSYTLGDVLSAYIGQVLGNHAFPSVADFFYLAFYPLFVTGVAFFQGYLPRGRDRLKVILDVLIIALTTWMYLWFFVQAPIVARAAQGITPQFIITLTYPTFDLLLLVAVLLILTRSHPAIRPSSMYWLLAAIIITIVGDSLYVTGKLETGLLSGRWAHILYAWSYILIALSARAQIQGKRSAQMPESSLAGISQFHRYFTAFVIGISFILWIILEITNTEFNHTLLVIQISLIAIFSILVSLLDSLDISRLYRQLITLNAELEAKVEARTAEVADLYNNAPVAYYSVGADLVIQLMNQTGLTWLGYAREQVTGIMKVTDLVLPEQRDYVTESLRQFFAAGQTKDLELAFIRADGTVLYGSVNSLAIRDAEGRVTAIRSSVQDITRRRKALDALHRSEQSLYDAEATYHSLFETSTDGIFLFTPDGKAINANPRGLRMLGYTLAEYLDRDRQEFDFSVAQEERTDAQKKLAAIRQGERVPDYERTFVRKDGARIVMEISLSPVVAPDGRLILIQSIIRDITDKKQTQSALIASEKALRKSRDQLSSANASLEKAAKLKDEFLASMSHELRTPLTGILGLSEVLQMQTYGELNEKQLGAMQNIEQAGRHLLELINDILDLSKIGANRLELTYELVSVHEVSQASLQMVKAQALKKGIELSYHAEPREAAVMADSRRLKQILVNLLSNAVKFTPNGGKVGLEATAANGILQIAVWDTGIGISAENMKKLFKPFIQLDSSLSREYAGSGLGLSLVARLVEMHGGSIHVESEVGVGSRFTLSFTWQGTLMDELHQSPPNQIQMKRVLLVEDNETHQKQITAQLRALGIETHIHGQGAGTLEEAVRFKPDAILLDLHLPDTDGGAVLRELKNDPRTAGIVVIISSVEENRGACMEQGAAGYLVKPFTQQELKTELARVAVPVPQPDQFTGEDKLNHSVLLVDDNEIILDTVSAVLTAAGCQVMTARSGYELLDIANRFHMDIILTDIQMPGMDGIQAIRQLRTSDSTWLRQVPVVAFTALVMPGDAEMCRNAGADYYLAKPLPMEQLVSIIKQLAPSPGHWPEDWPGLNF